MLAIGNELLSGKVQDANMSYLAGELHALGVQLVLALFVPDQVPDLVDAIHYARGRADIIITTGGVGPTHDDVTLKAVAAAFQRELVREPALVDAVHEYYGESVNDEVLTMAEVPAGAELLQPAPFFLPIFKLENVYCFPGVPGAFQLLFDAWKESIRQTPYHVLRCELDADEGVVAPLLKQVQDAHASLQIGSYPRYEEGAPYRVLVTLEGKDRDLVESAGEQLINQLRSSLGEAALLRVTPPPAPN